MANRFHISPTSGNAGLCVAAPGNCPHGSEEDHYLTEADARQAFELKNALAAIPTAASRAPAPNHLPHGPHAFAGAVAAIADEATNHSPATLLRGISVSTELGLPKIELSFNTWQGAHLAQQELHDRAEVVATMIPAERNAHEQRLRVVPFDHHKAIHASELSRGGAAGVHIIAASSLDQAAWPPRFITDSNGGREEILMEEATPASDDATHSWIFHGVADRNFTLVVLTD